MYIFHPSRLTIGQKNDVLAFINNRLDIPSSVICNEYESQLVFAFLLLYVFFIHITLSARVRIHKLYSNLQENWDTFKEDIKLLYQFKPLSQVSITWKVMIKLCKHVVTSLQQRKYMSICMHIKMGKCISIHDLKNRHIDTYTLYIFSRTKGIKKYWKQWIKYIRKRINNIKGNKWENYVQGRLFYFVFNHKGIKNALI
jgi:hypothetical protein